MNKEIKIVLLIASFSMAVAICLGAVGSHLLSAMVSYSQMQTFETGVRYQIYHSLALLIVAALHTRLVQLKPRLAYIFFTIGILFFSINCYIYTLTSNKFFVMLVPIGGFAMILGWVCLLITIKRDL